MAGQLFDIEDGQAVRGENLAGRMQREVGVMLVVDGVEFAALNQVKQVGEFEGGHAGWLEQDAEAFDEVVDVGHVSQHVVGRHQIGGVVGCQGASGFGAKEEDFGGDALGDGGFGAVAGGFDAQDGDAGGVEVLEEIAVVAGDFHHPVAWAEAEALHHGPGVAPRVIEPGVGEG